MQIEAAYALYQQILMYAGVGGLALLFVGVALWKFMPIWDDVWSKFLKLDGFGKVIACGAFALATLYGGSKSFSWHKVANDGADTGIALVGIYTGTSNDVVEVEGVTTTNQIPMVGVFHTGTALATSTEISVRMSDTNEWTALTKVNPRIEVNGTTNALVFATAQDYSGFTYWWAGSDRPAVVITSTGIEILSFTATSHSVTISWSCDNPLAETFQIQYKGLTESVWHTALTTTAKTATVSGFWVGQTLDWRIISEYLEDGE